MVIGYPDDQRYLLAGNVQIVMDNLPTYLWHARSGALRALAVSSTERWPTAPDVPSIAEHGYPDFEASMWWYVAAPAGTRLELVTKLSDKIVQGLQSEAVVRKVRESGASERPGNAEELAPPHRRREGQVEEGDQDRWVEAAVVADH